jgi:hypothetical protein
MIRAGSSLTIYPPRLVNPPIGVETYKLIVTTSPTVNFAIFEQPIGAKAAATSPLEWLFGQATNSLTRDSMAIKNVKLDDWATASVDIMIAQ